MSQPRDATLFEHLTPREREVLDLLRLGLTDREIAARLEITPQGASYHVSQIIGRLGVRNRHEASTWPEQPPWWLRTLALSRSWRTFAHQFPTPLNWAAQVASLFVFAVVLGGLVLLAFLLFRSGGAEERPRNIIVFQHGADLWVASVDGATPPQQITAGIPRVEYSGYVRRPHGAMDIYYLADEGKKDENGTPGRSLYRIALGRGAKEQLLFLPGLTPASVAPDGKHVLYTNKDGVMLLDLASGKTTQVVSTSCPPGPPGCPHYTSAHWSPNGNMAAGFREFLEGGPLVLFRPFESPAKQAVLGQVAQGFSWSPDGRQVCTWTQQGVTGASMLVYDTSSGRLSADILGALGLGRARLANAFGCAWSKDGRFAAGYNLNFDSLSGQIAILDKDFNVIERSDPIEYLNSVDSWLADGAVVFSRAARPQPAPIAPGIYRPGGGVSDLLATGDTILDVIP